MKLINILALAIVLLNSCSQTEKNEATSKPVIQKSSNQSLENVIATQYALDTNLSVLKWLGWEGPRKRNHTHFGTMKFSKGKISVRKGEILEGKFSMSLASIFVEDLSGAKKDILKKHLMEQKFFNVALFPNIEVEITSSSGGISVIEIQVLGKKIKAKVPIKIVKSPPARCFDMENCLIAKTEKFQLNFKDLGIKGFEPNKKNPNESISPIIEFELDLIFNK